MARCRSSRRGRTTCPTARSPISAARCRRSEGESIVFSWIVWPSREARDEGNKKVMADPRMQPTGGDVPFDMKRMIFGGFKPIVQTGSNP